MQRVAPSDKTVRKLLEMWVFTLQIKKKILVKKKSTPESILTLKRGLKVKIFIQKLITTLRYLATIQQ